MSVWFNAAACRLDLVSFRADCQNSLPDALLGAIADNDLGGTVLKVVLIL